MARRESQVRAENKYRREKTKTITVRFYPSEMDIYEFARSQENTAGLIKGLIAGVMGERRA